MVSEQRREYSRPVPGKTQMLERSTGIRYASTGHRIVRAYAMPVPDQPGRGYQIAMLLRSVLVAPYARSVPCAMWVPDTA
eukprot:1456187-Rhodomonas_salina.3